MVIHERAADIQHPSPMNTMQKNATGEAAGEGIYYYAA